jgi:hypothetical protein
MNKLEKKYTKINFLKMLLVQSSMPRCNFCKYHWNNYKYINKKMQNLAMDHFISKCKTCINSRSYLKLKEEEKHKKYWYEDNFKPLYDWEESDFEGVNNE